MIETLGDQTPSDLINQKVLFEALSTRKLHLTIFPTEQCNFRCTYCYEDFAIGRMSRETVEGVKNLISRRAEDLDLLLLSWFGGEPIVAYDLVKEISAHAKKVADSGAFKVRGQITTNGYRLSEQRYIEMEALGLTGYQISLDGDQAAHDTTRLRIDGKGTFDRIWSNVVLFNAMRERAELIESTVLLRVHVHPGNMASVFALTERIRNELNPEWFRVHIKNVGHYGGPNDSTFEVFRGNDETFRASMTKLKSSLAAYIPLGDGMPSVCYASKGNALTIRADGSVGKCTVALSDAANAIGRLLPDGTLEIDQDKMAPWLHGLQSMNPADLACPISRLPRVAVAA